MKEKGDENVKDYQYDKKCEETSHVCKSVVEYLPVFCHCFGPGSWSIWNPSFTKSNVSWLSFHNQCDSGDMPRTQQRSMKPEI